jgi:hypothetical protein
MVGHSVRLLPLSKSIPAGMWLPGRDIRRIRRKSRSSAVTAGRLAAPKKPKNPGFTAFSALTWRVAADKYAQLSAGGEFRLVGTAS